MATSAFGPAERGGAVLVRVDPRGPVVADAHAPLLRADDVGALRGDGVFERFLVGSGRPRHFDDHLFRLARSAALTGLEVPGAPAWRAAVQAGTQAWTGSPQWEMRLVCTRGPEAGGPPTAYVLGQELNVDLLRQRRDGVAVVSIERGLSAGLVTDAPWLLLGAKTLSYAVNMAGKRWAAAQGADDSIFVGADGYVWEATTSAVVAAFGRRLLSPPASIGILDSISVAHFFRAAGAAGWDVAREQVSLDDLLAADGVWLLSSLRFARAHTLNGKALPPLPPTHQLLAELEAGS